MRIPWKDGGAGGLSGTPSNPAVIAGMIDSQTGLGTHWIINVDAEVSYSAYRLLAKGVD